MIDIILLVKSNMNREEILEPIWSHIDNILFILTYIEISIEYRFDVIRAQDFVSPTHNMHAVFVGKCSINYLKIEIW